MKHTRETIKDLFKTMRYVIAFCFIFVACSVKTKYPNNDINASLNATYYNFTEDTEFLYNNKLYSRKEFEKKYDIKSFKTIEIIRDSETISKLTQNSACKAIVKVSD